MDFAFSGQQSPIDHSDNLFSIRRCELRVCLSWQIEFDLFAVSAFRTRHSLHYRIDKSFCVRLQQHTRWHMK